MTSLWDTGQASRNGKIKLRGFFFFFFLRTRARTLDFLNFPLDVVEESMGEVVHLSLVLTGISYTDTVPMFK